MGKMMCGARPGYWIGLAAVWFVCLGPPAWAAAPSPEQRKQVRAADAALKRSASLYRSQRFAEAGEAFQDAQQQLGALGDADSRELAALTAPLRKQLTRLRDLLEAEGVKLTAAKTPGAADKPGEKSNGKQDGVSFTGQVAPILVARCGGCHIQRARGELSMATYVSLSKGSAAGTVIMAGDAKGSRLVELVESGDMPRGGAKVTAEELATVVAWINAGAKFDGRDSAAPLSSFAPMKKDEAPAPLKVIAASGREEVQFARDVAPTLVAHCLDCHGEQNPRANFSLNTLSGLLRGGDSGATDVPGKGDESLLVKKLRGLAGQRMPLDKPALDEATIAKIDKWIALGARFDGGDPALTLDELVMRSVAERAMHEELSKQRVELAARHWRLIQPDGKANHEDTANLLVYGTVGATTLADVARGGEDQVAKLRKLFKVPPDQPFIKGRLTLYVFEKRYEYGEVGTMLEHREIPAAWRGHWHFDPLDAYACVLLSSGGEVSPGLLAQQLAGAYVASLGKIPHWFAEGTARTVAARLEPKDSRIKACDEQVGRILVATDKPEGFLTGALQAEENDLLSYSFVKYLATQPVRQAGLLASLQQGASFDAAFGKAYGGPPRQSIGAWLARAQKRGH